MLNIAVICGGPSLERGISLNSARSLLDHLPNDNLAVHPLYVDQDLKFHMLSPSQLYSNTPADFDFKLAILSESLDEEALRKFFKKIDIAFPCIHGAFGEDGCLQSLLEEMGVPFIGSDSQSSRMMFQKHKAYEMIKKRGYPFFSSLVLQNDQKDILEQITGFFSTHHLTRAIVKPSSGGSSIGVFSVGSPLEAYEKCIILFSRHVDSHVIIEPFCVGREFTIAVLESSSGSPVAFLPTEIETCYDNHQIFDFRKKYLPTNNTKYHTPPHFEDSIITQICSEAEQLFEHFNMRDFVRMDGWVMPDGSIYFTDFNPLCGLEQNSFLFQQAALLGLTHKEVLYYIVRNACRRYEIAFPQFKNILNNHKLPVHVIFGSKNAERQVSLMSGTNIWLKLLVSDCYAPTPILQDINGDLWILPYRYALYHTVEEIYANCCAAEKESIKTNRLAKGIQERLGIKITNQQIPFLQLLFDVSYGSDV